MVRSPAFIDDTWRGVGDTIAAGGTLSHEQRTMTRLALYRATWAAEEISVAVYRAAGTTALRSGALQLYFRDMHAGTQHVTSAPGRSRTVAGRSPGWPGHEWLYMNLVPVAES